MQGIEEAKAQAQNRVQRTISKAHEQWGGHIDHEHDRDHNQKQVHELNRMIDWYVAELGAKEASIRQLRHTIDELRLAVRQRDEFISTDMGLFDDLQQKTETILELQAQNALLENRNDELQRKLDVLIF